MIKKFGLKLSIAAMMMIAAVVGVILILMINATNNLVSDMLFSQSKTANAAFAESFARYQEQALERAEMIAGSAEIVSAVENGDHAGLLKALNNFSVGVDLITLCDAEGNVLARTHNDKTGDSVLNQEAISVALSAGKGIKTIEPGTVIGLSTRGSAAIKDANGKIIGALTCGHDLSQTKYVDEIKAQNNCEATFFVGNVRMNTTLIDESGNRAVGTSAGDGVVATVINNKKDYTSRLGLFGKTYEAYYSPVIVNGQSIGMLFTGVHIDDTLAQERNMVVMIVITVIMLLLSVLITVFIIRWMTNKTHWYESLLDSIPSPISVTDMDMKWTFINKPVEQMLNVKRSDMLGKHCSNWGAAICNTGNCGVACLKNGKNMTIFEQMGMDFKVDVSYIYNARGKQIGHIEIVGDITELLKTQKSQAGVVVEISQISRAFVQGSKQIADGAQTLAQGSAEQATVVERLSASVADIAQKTKTNAEMAGRAANLANIIKQNAQKGSDQMNQMTSAVKEINEASQSVNKVIKVIDDIAFQTNILALNAAVEAARAGQHGKGFAVVAEEVRNLAAKSAEAAKNTSGLIANSMEKAALGAKIAGETAASLEEIVAGINESNQIVGGIAESSNEQSSAIAQINNAIEQVTLVVHQNSATSEQSAAASQELSGQSAQLDEIISRFERENNLQSTTVRLGIADRHADQ